MLRRDFLKTTGAALAFSAMPAYAQQFADMKKRVALIGTGWYGKSDLFRLLQVAPVEVVSLCDADSNLLNECADMVAERQLSKKRPRTFKRLPGAARPEGRRHRADRHARSLARAADDRGGQGRLRHLRAEADQRRRPRGPGDAGGGAQVQARRPGRHAAPQHAAPDHGPRPHHPRRQAGQGRPGRDLLLLRDAGDARTRPTRRRRPTSTTSCGPGRRRCGRTTRWSTRAGGAPTWSTATASSATCACTCSTWSAGCSTSACRTAIASSGGILIEKESRANITDTQTATFDFGDLPVIWTHRTYGRAARSEVSVGRDDLRRQGHAQGRASMSYDFIPTKGEPIHEDVKLRARGVPDRQGREGSREARRPGHPRPHEEPADVHPDREKPVSDIEQGYISATSCILANMSQKLGRSLTWDHAKGEVVGDAEANKAAGASVSRALQAPRRVVGLSRR